MRAAAVTAALLLSGCAGTPLGNTIEAAAQQKWKAVTDEMKLVLPHVKPAHLTQCQDLLQQPTMLGSKYVIPAKARLLPSLQHSCVEQDIAHRRLFESKRKVVVLAVEMEHVAGLDLSRRVQGCTFTLNQDDMTITVGRSLTTAPASNFCHYIR